MQKFEGIANTLFVPLVARINISKKFPEYFIDRKALELEPYLPENADKGSFEYTDITSAARYFNMDKMVIEFAEKQKSCNIVYLGAGLETAYYRLNNQVTSANWYQVDLPEVIEARKMVLGQQENESLIDGDMFEMKWAKEMNSSLPTMLVVSGVFQYFREEEVINFIKDCARAFPEGEMIFDATSKSGLKFTNWFIRRTGNSDSVMHFGIDDSKKFADKCGLKLLEERTFFTDALIMLGGKLGFITRMFMKISEKKKRVIILQLSLKRKSEKTKKRA
ncbi:MAG: class I SAM-dependent methyltransferase [Lentihominibacter sp.]|jgi:O-methyltransferase involved in polyketide biosynthesis